MAEMTDADIDRKLNEWISVRHIEWAAWFENVYRHADSNGMVILAMRLAFRAGMDETKQENAK